jgi:hypothetical protein
MGNLTGLMDVTVSRNNWIADINYLAFSGAVSPFNGRYGVVGVTYVGVNYGEFQGTMVSTTAPEGYVKTDLFYPKASSAGVGYAIQLTDRFAVGTHFKFASQSLGENLIQEEDSTFTRKNEASTTGIDFGTIYQTNLRSLAFGMSITNYSQEVKYERENFQLPLIFRIGISVEAFQFFNMPMEGQDLYVVVDAVHPRAYHEYLNIGLEYRLFDNLLTIRGGYSSGRDEENIAFGFGIEKFGVAIDYAYTPFGVFNPVQRFSIRFAY